MLIVHQGKKPKIHPSAWVAPDASVCGDVTVGAGSRISCGARVIGEAGGVIKIGRNCIVRENAVIRATDRHPCTIGDHCLIGPNAYVAGAILEGQVFVATAATIFHGAHLGLRSEVFVRGIVHIRSRLKPEQVVPIGWIAVGDPAHILPPHAHDDIWAILKPLNFPEWVYGFDRDTPDLMVKITERLADMLGSHLDDMVLAP